MYRLSRYWNRLAYLFIRIGRKMIWDQTGKNAYLLKNYLTSEVTEGILCNR